MNATDRATINKIANLIEQGSVGYRQITGAYKEADGVCALGACFEAANIQGMFPIEQLKRNLHITEWPRVMYPIDTPYWRWLHEVDKPMPLDDALISLNDSAGWSFDQIVNWLRSIAAEATITSEPA